MIRAPAWATVRTDAGGRRPRSAAGAVGARPGAPVSPVRLSGACSPSARNQPISSPQANVSPTWPSSVQSSLTPAASTSVSVLSVSMRSSAAPAVTASPSSANHSVMVPSSIVSPSLGMMNSVAMDVLSSWSAVCEGRRRRRRSVDRAAAIARVVSTSRSRGPDVSIETVIVAVGRHGSGPLAVEGEDAAAGQIDRLSTSERLDRLDVERGERAGGERDAHPPSAGAEPDEHAAGFVAIDGVHPSGDAGHAGAGRIGDAGDDPADRRGVARRLGRRRTRCRSGPPRRARGRGRTGVASGRRCASATRLARRPTASTGTAPVATSAAATPAVVPSTVDGNTLLVPVEIAMSGDVGPTGGDVATGAVTTEHDDRADLLLPHRPRRRHGVEVRPGERRCRRTRCHRRGPRRLARPGGGCRC